MTNYPPLHGAGAGDVRPVVCTGGTIAAGADMGAARCGSRGRTYNQNSLDDGFARESRFLGEGFYFGEKVRGYGDGDFHMGRRVAR